MAQLVGLAATVLAVGVHGHGQLTKPIVRPDTEGRVVSHLQREPVFTLGGPRGAGLLGKGYPATAMRCHNFGPSSNAPQTTLQAGLPFQMTWTCQACHPGDCYAYLSYDSDASNPDNFFKIAAFPGCGAPDGKNPPSSVTQTVVLPAQLPSCDHCVLRWEWTAHQQVVDIEFYVQCADVKIESVAVSTRPSPLTAIAGIEHLPSNADAYRKVYNGQGPEQQFLVGPAVATYSVCKLGEPGCIGNGVGGGTGGGGNGGNGGDNGGNSGGSSGDSGFFSRIAAFFRWIWDSIVGFFRGLAGGNGGDVVEACSGSGEDCRPTACCKEPDHKCFMQNPNFASCKLKCQKDDGWLCHVITTVEIPSDSKSATVMPKLRWPQHFAVACLGSFVAAAAFFVGLRTRQQRREADQLSELEESQEE